MEELVEKVKNGDKEIYIYLINDLKEEMYRIAKERINDYNDIEDIIQETIINGYLKISQLRNNKYFKTWIIKILINECNRFYKRKRRYDDINTKCINDLETIHIEDDSIGFDNLIQDLNDIEKNIFKLYYEEGYSINEVANILKINPNTIKTKLRRGKKKISATYKEIIMLIVILGFITTGITFGRDIINYLKDIFNLSSIGQSNDGILMAIEEKELIQNIDMNFIVLDGNYKIRVNYLIIDDINMYMVFELQSNEILEYYDRFSILDLKIKDNNNDIVCEDDNLMESSIAKLKGWKNINSNNNTIKELVYMFSYGYPEIEALEIEFSKIVLYKDNNPSKETKVIEVEDKNIHLDIDEKFRNRETIEYIPKNNNEKYYIQKTIITDTGFYAIVKSKVLKLNSNIKVNGNKIHCNYRLLDTEYNNGQRYYYLLSANIRPNNNINEILLEINNSQIELYKNKK